MCLEPFVASELIELTGAVVKISAQRASAREQVRGAVKHCVALNLLYDNERQYPLVLMLSATCVKLLALP
jgi:hypothetical protein